MPNAERTHGETSKIVAFNRRPDPASRRLGRALSRENRPRPDWFAPQRDLERLTTSLRQEVASRRFHVNADRSRRRNSIYLLDMG
jgi:hypothetical protein